MAVGIAAGIAAVAGIAAGIAVVAGIAAGIVVAAGIVAGMAVAAGRIVVEDLLIDCFPVLPARLDSSNKIMI